VPPADQYWESLRRVGLDAGLDAIGVAPATEMTRAREALEHRISSGLVNEMQFTFRNPERSTTPTRSVPWVRSIVVGAASHARHSAADDRTDGLEHRPAAGRPAATVAVYAREHAMDDLRDSLEVVARRLRDDGHRAAVFADDNAIVDREAARLAGIGWYGKNANLLLPGKGSMFTLGCVFTDAELPVAGPVGDGCGTCARCIPACPTGAIVAPGVIDANRCLAWVLQKPGSIPVALREAVGDRIYGCDDCQSACPHNQRLGTGSGPVAGRTPGASIDPLWILAADDAAVMGVCGDWYIHGRDPRWLRRNALVILGNVGDGSDPDTVAAIRAAETGGDPVLAEHARWAAARLGLGGGATD
jgi:epoxyqueuosine reductase